MKKPLAIAIAVFATGSAPTFVGCDGAGPGPSAREGLAESAASASADSPDSWGPQPGRWVATWAAAPMPPDSAFDPPRSFENQTLRHIVHVSAGGKQVRVRLSNAFGSKPLRIGGAQIARHGGGASIVPGSGRVLTFSGQPSITIPTGAAALSDPVELKAASRSELAVSVYVPENTGPATYHESSIQTAYISPPGDFTGSTELPVAETTRSWFWLSVVEVKAAVKVPAVVAIGDSITKGFGSTVNENRRWPDLLSARFNPTVGLPRLAVLNQGIGCSRLLRDICGPNGSGRFDRDVLAITGATHVVAALGLNDIGLPGVIGAPDQVVSADEVIVGLRQLVERAHAKELAIYGATITPIGSSTVPGFFTPENEAKRQAVNHWVRTGGAFDGVIDFDEAVRDPARPDRLLAIYDCGDGIHPNDTGYQAMADAVDPSLFW